MDRNDARTYCITKLYAKWLDLTERDLQPFKVNIECWTFSWKEGNFTILKEQLHVADVQSDGTVSLSDKIDFTYHFPLEFLKNI